MNERFGGKHRRMDGTSYRPCDCFSLRRRPCTATRLERRQHARIEEHWDSMAGVKDNDGRVQPKRHGAYGLHLVGACENRSHI